MLLHVIVVGYHILILHVLALIGTCDYCGKYCTIASGECRACHESTCRPVDEDDDPIGGQLIVPGTHTHYYTGGTCQTISRCSCGEYGSLGNHSYSSTCGLAHCGKSICSYCGDHKTLPCGGGHNKPETYSSNSTQHWKKCTYSGCTYYYVSVANHIDTSPTNGVCDVCSYNMDTTPPVIEYVSKQNTTTNNSAYAKSGDIVRIVIMASDANLETCNLTTEDIMVNVGGVVLTTQPFKMLTAGTTTSTEKKWILTLSGIDGNGNLFLTIGSGKVTDIAGLTNSTTTINCNMLVDNESPNLGELLMNVRRVDGVRYVPGAQSSENIYVRCANGSDSGSGHKSTAYSINGGAYTAETTILSSSGTYRITLKTEDMAGNIAFSSAYTVNIYKARTLTVKINNITDIGSGVASVNIKVYHKGEVIDERLLTTFSPNETIRFSVQDGTYNVVTTITDKVGNSKELKRGLTL